MTLELEELARGIAIKHPTKLRKEIMRKAWKLDFHIKKAQHFLAISEESPNVEIGLLDSPPLPKKSDHLPLFLQTLKYNTL
jgi:hypothetical protein